MNALFVEVRLKQASIMLSIGRLKIFHASSTQSNQVIK